MIENCVLNVPRIIGHTITAKRIKFITGDCVKPVYMIEKIECVYHSGLAKVTAKKHSAKTVDSRPKK